MLDLLVFWLVLRKCDILNVFFKLYLLVIMYVKKSESLVLKFMLLFIGWEVGWYENNG